MVMFFSETHREYVTVHYEILYFTRKYGQIVASWRADAVRSRRHAVSVSPLCCSEDVLFFAGISVGSLFFSDDSIEVQNSPLSVAKLWPADISGKHNPWSHKLGGTANDQPWSIWIISSFLNSTFCMFCKFENPLILKISHGPNDLKLTRFYCIYKLKEFHQNW